MILLRSLKSGLNETNSHKLSTPLTKSVLYDKKNLAIKGGLENFVPWTTTITEKDPPPDFFFFFGSLFYGLVLDHSDVMG